MVEKRGLKYHKKAELTPAEKEVLHLLTDKFLTVKKIALRRRTSLQAVYKLVKSLKKKGAIGAGVRRVEKVESTTNKSDIRLHGQEINVRIISQSHKYQTQLEKSNVLSIDGNTIRLYRKSVEIYFGHSFFGKTINEAEEKSLEYLNHFLSRLEHDLGVGLLKQRSRNIRIVNQHYARGDSEICDKAIEERKRVWVYAEEDGKLAFITDDSFGFKEDETVHPKTAKKDRGAVDKQVNDWRLNNPPTNSQLASHISKVTENQTMFAENMASHIKAIQDLSKGVKKLTTVVSRVKKENMKLKLGKQKTLGDF